VFAQLLYDPAVWKKWAGRDQTKAANWAPMPTPPVVKVVVPAADKKAALWHYTLVRPTEDWMQPTFDAAKWSEGWGGFGTHGTPGAVIGTVWSTANIWLRRDVDLTADQCKNPELWLHHDEDTEVYINGVLALKTRGFDTEYESFPLTPPGRAALKPGKNLIAIHCHQTTGGQYVDAGFVTVENP
jgi:hypothetical protein